MSHRLLFSVGGTVLLCLACGDNSFSANGDQNDASISDASVQDAGVADALGPDARAIEEAGSPGDGGVSDADASTCSVCPIPPTSCFTSVCRSGTCVTEPGNFGTKCGSSGVNNECLPDGGCGLN